MYEPRGHSAMSGAILQPPTRPDADFGVLFIEVSGCLPMCGHGTIGVATVLVETGMVPVTTPVTTVRLDVPAGLVVAEVAVRADGAATGVTIHNVPSFPVALDASVDVPGLGEVRYDLAFGGNFYAIVELAKLGLPFERSAGVAAARRRTVHHGCHQRGRLGRCTPSTRHQRMPPRLPRRTGVGRPPLPARHGHPPRLVRPFAMRHRHLGPDGAAVGARRARPAPGLRQRVLSSAGISSAG